MKQATPDATGRTKPILAPLLCVAIGIAYLVAGLVGGEPDLAVLGPVLMLGLAAALLLLRRRSETVRGLLDRRDERINSFDLQATAATGGVLIAAIILAFMVEVFQGQSGAPYDWLGAIGGLTYVVALVVLRLRG